MSDKPNLGTPARQQARQLTHRLIREYGMQNGDLCYRLVYEAIQEVEARAAGVTVPAVPDDVWEALQRLIENAESLGPSSKEDALLVARWRGQFVAARERAAGLGDGAERRVEAFIERRRTEYTPGGQPVTVVDDGVTVTHHESFCDQTVMPESKPE